MNKDTMALQGARREIAGVTRRSAAVAGIVASIALGVYVRTLAPTVYTFDSAEFATGAYSLGIIHATGYPLYLLLAHAFTLLPVGDVAYRVNLMSAVWGAVTVGLLCVLCSRVTGRLWPGVAASLLFGFSHYYWREAVIAETYTLNTVLITLLILLLWPASGTFSRGRFLAAGLVLGLSFANHMSTILMLPALAFWAFVNNRSRAQLARLVVFGAGVGLGLLVYLYLPLRYNAGPPLDYARQYFATDLTTPRGLIAWITGEMFRPYMAAYDPVALLAQGAEYLTWLWINFFGAGVIVGCLGIVWMARTHPRLDVFLALVFVAYALFFINYRVVNKDTMFSVTYLVWSIWIACGAVAIEAWFASRPIGARLTQGALLSLALLALVANWQYSDQSHNRMASEFAGGLLANAKPSAWIVTEWTWATPLEYLQIVDKRRPDVVVFDRGLYGLALWNRMRREGIPDSIALDRIEQSLSEMIQGELAIRPVYATEYDENLARQFHFVPEGPYYRLEAQAPPAP